MPAFLFHKNEFVAFAPDVYYRDTLIGAKVFAQLGNEHVHTAGIEKAVAAPQVEQYLAAVKRFIFPGDQMVKQFAFQMGKPGNFIGNCQRHGDPVKQVAAQFELAALLLHCAAG